MHNDDYFPSMTVINQSKPLSTPPVLFSLSVATPTNTMSLHDLVKQAFSTPSARIPIPQAVKPNRVRFNPFLTSVILIPSRSEIRPHRHLLYYTGDEERLMRQDPDHDGDSEDLRSQYNTFADYKLTLDNTILNCQLNHHPQPPITPIEPPPALPSLVTCPYRTRKMGVWRCVVGHGRAPLPW